MNTIKSAVTVLFLLAVSYGVYRLIHTPDPVISSDGQFFVQVDPLGMTSPQQVSESKPASTGPATIAPSPFQNSMGIEAPSLTSPTPISSVNVAATGESPSNISKASGEQPNSSQPTTQLISATPPASINRTASAPIDGANSKEVSTGDPPAIMTGPLTTVAPRSESPNPAPPAPIIPQPNKELTTTLPPMSSEPFEAVRQANPAAPEVKDLRTAWSVVDAQVRRGAVADSLALLSTFYNSDLSEADRTELLHWLDALAFKVIYSTEHQLVPTPHIVKDGETIESIASEWKIPKELLLNINRSKIPADGILTPGLELKVMRGPFRAEIDSQRKELTLFLDQCYAGRFAIDTTNCSSLTAGRHAIQAMSVDPSGQYRLMFQNGLSLVAGAPTPGDGAIQLSVADARDLFGILSGDSPVTVVR